MQFCSRRFQVTLSLKAGGFRAENVALRYANTRPFFRMSSHSEKGLTEFATRGAGGKV